MSIYSPQRGVQQALLLTGVLLAGAVASFGQEKLPVPDDGAQAEAVKLIRELYEQDYKGAKTPAEQTALANKLLEQAAVSKDDPTAHFVLLRVARDMAVQAGDANTALEAVDQIARTYQIDATLMRVETLLSAAANARLADARKAVAEAAIPLIRAAIGEDDYETANRLVRKAFELARRSRDSELLKQMVAVNREVADSGKAYAEVQQARAKLEEKPTDPEANLAVGRYLCVSKGDWEKGIPMLALGSDPALKALAGRELEEVDSPDAQVALADTWWDLAQKRTGPEKESFLLRAGYWYQEAEASLTSGLAKVKVRKRLEEIAKLGRPAPTAPAAAKTPKPRPQLPAGSILLMTFEPDTFTSKDGQVYVADKSGFGNHGIVTGATQTPSGRAGASLEFSEQDYVLLPTLRTYLTGQLRQLTISVWVSPTNVRGIQFVFDVGDYGTRCISLFFRDGRPTFWLANRYGGETCASDTAEATGQWHHVVAVWNGTEQRIYVDAQLKATEYTQNLILNPTSISAEPARLGTQAKSALREQRHFQGLMDEVAIFPRALSDEEIQTLHQMGLDGETLAKPGRTRSAR